MKKLLSVLTLALAISSCGQQQVVYTPPPPKPKKDELKLTLEQMAKNVEKLEKLKEGKEEKLPVPVKVKKDKKEVIVKKIYIKPKPKRKKEKLYSFIGTNMSLASAITYTFGNDYSISFGKGVNVNYPITAVIRNQPVSVACNEIVKQAGYICKVDKKHKVISVLGVEEAYIQLPAGFEDYVIKSKLGGDILKSGSSSTSTSSFMPTSSGGNSGISSGSKIEYDMKTKREDVLNFFKSFLTRRGKLSIDWNTNILYVKDTPQVVEAIKEFVNKARQTLGKEIYIKARLAFVITNRDLETGIDWKRLIEAGSNKKITISFNSLPTNQVFSIEYKGDFTSILFQYLDQIGKVKEILSPEIRTLNLTPALLVRGTNIPYVNYNPVVSSSGLGTTITTNTEINYAFNGIQFYVKPYAYEDTIYLTLQPSISSVDGYDTFTDSQGNAIKVPQTSITAQTTRIALKNNSTIVMGALVWDGSKRITTGIPLFDEIPLVGLLFKHQQKIKNKIYIVLSIYAREDKV